MALDFIAGAVPLAVALIVGVLSVILLTDININEGTVSLGTNLIAGALSVAINLHLNLRFISYERPR